MKLCVSIAHCANVIVIDARKIDFSAIRRAIFVTTNIAYWSKSLIACNVLFSANAYKPYSSLLRGQLFIHADLSFV